MTLYFASHNLHKVEEIRAILPAGIELKSLVDLNQVKEIPETGSTIAENSMLKAQYVYAHYGVSCFADDTGLEVTALNDAPGIYSARYAGLQKNSEDNMNLLLQNLDGIEDRSARFKTVITYLTETGAIHQFTGTVEGKITLQKSGTSGFGYDPIFLPEGYDQTFAEMPLTLKNEISHRGKAFKALVQFLKTEMS